MFTRPATLSDAADIADIYNYEVHSGVATFDMTPRTAAEQQEWLRSHAGAHPCIVAIEGTASEPGRLTGWACLSPYRPRPAYSTSVEDSVYVHPDFQRQGVGDLLLADLINISDSLGFHSIFARISGETAGYGALAAGAAGEAASGASKTAAGAPAPAKGAASGAASIALHHKHGFELVGVEREVGRKFGRWLDVTLMQRIFVSSEQ